MKEIEVAQLKKMPKDSYVLVDIRDEGSVLYGIIPGAVPIAANELEENPEAALENIEKDKMLVLYCQKGERSAETAEVVEESGRECYSLKGGYHGYLMSLFSEKQEDNKENAEEEVSRQEKAE